MAKSFVPKSALWALDFGAHGVSVQAVREKTAGDWVLMGEGRSRALGTSSGEIAKLSDVVEAVTAALREAEKSAGMHCRRLYFNFDDAGIMSAHPSGSKTLSGEGQIRREDVRDAARSASRMAGDFERSPIYMREVDYLIDGKDSVGNPFGVFGHRLDVTLHVILARARRVQQWKNVMLRAQIERYTPVLSLDSAAQAVLGRKPERHILWDLGDDYVSGAVIERGVLRDYRVHLTEPHKMSCEKIEAASREWMAKHQAAGPILLTGDWAEKASLGLESRVETATGGPKWLEKTQDAAMAGLVMTASQRERRIASVQTGGQWALRAKEKANAFIQEYF